MGLVLALIAVIALILIPWAGAAGGGQYLFGVVFPYAAIIIFIAGMIFRVQKWARSAVPFRIPTTGGQQKSFDWIPHSKLDNPYTVGQTYGRMFLEVFLFRSLFRNTALDYSSGPRISYASSKWLWLFAITFHYAFFTTLFRHLRLFTDPVPVCVTVVEKLDSFMEIGLPVVMQSGLILLGAASILLIRRLLLPQVRYISLVNDYFPLCLIIAIASTGALMRYFVREDIVAVKELTMSLVALSPTIPATVTPIFYIHLFLVSVLLVYFPFSKLMHAPGVFFSPTRNLANNSRAVRHVNPWDYPVKFHTYDAYEDEFREKMAEAGLPLDKQPEASESAAEDE